MRPILNTAPSAPTCRPVLDSMHPHQHTVFANMEWLLAVVPTLARTGIADVLFDPKEGTPKAPWTRAGEALRLGGRVGGRHEATSTCGVELACSLR